MSEPFVSVIGAAEVPAGPVQRQILLNEIELNSIKSNPIALKFDQMDSIQFVANLFRFHGSTTLPFTADSTDLYSSTSSWVTTTGT